MDSLWLYGSRFLSAFKFLKRGIRRFGKKSFGQTSLIDF